jgi:hypothetical protein
MAAVLVVCEIVAVVSSGVQPAPTKLTAKISAPNNGKKKRAFIVFKVLSSNRYFQWL